MMIKKINSREIVMKALILVLALLLIVNTVHADTEWGNPTDPETEMQNSNPRCVHDATNAEWVWYNAVGIQIRENASAPTSSGIGGCYKDNAFSLDSGSRVCCPDSQPICQTADSTASDYLHCLAGPSVQYCREYKNLQECENYTADVSIRSMEEVNGTGFCSMRELVLVNETECTLVVSSCKCWWDEDETQYDKCKPGNNFTLACPGEDLTSSECTYTLSDLIGNCSTEKEVTAKFLASWSGWNPDNPAYNQPQDCSDKTTTYPCPTQLSFFTTASLIIAILLIIIVYFFISRKNRKFKRRKK
jgi:hypothetical protein